MAENMTPGELMKEESKAKKPGLFKRFTAFCDEHPKAAQVMAVGGAAIGGMIINGIFKGVTSSAEVKCWESHTLNNTKFDGMDSLG